MTAPDKETVDLKPWTLFPDLPPGNVTLGGLFSEHASGVYLDSITGLWATRKADAFLFLDSRYHYEDNGQFINGTGLGFRKLLPDQKVILGVNAFWDSISSARDNDFQQLGLGAEILTEWVDWRFNYYLPDDNIYEVGRSSESHTHESLSPDVRGGSFIDLVRTTHTQHFKQYEGALEGFNTELGFLIPGVEKYIEMRIFAGYYHYDNPFGHDFNGFHGRLEAYLLPGVVAGVEYWDDAALMGGHWTGELRVSVPFSIVNLVHLRNPFAGIGDYFTPRRRSFDERMGDMIIRSHRIQTVTSGNLPSGSSTSREVTAFQVAPF